MACVQNIANECIRNEECNWCSNVIDCMNQNSSPTDFVQSKYPNVILANINDRCTPWGNKKSAIQERDTKPIPCLMSSKESIGKFIGVQIDESIKCKQHTYCTVHEK